MLMNDRQANKLAELLAVHEIADVAPDPKSEDIQVSIHDATYAIDNDGKVTKFLFMGTEDERSEAELEAEDRAVDRAVEREVFFSC